MVEKLLPKLFKNFYLSSYSLSLFRIFIGFNLLYDLVFFKFFYLEELFLSKAIFSTQFLQKVYGVYSYSIFNLSGNSIYIYGVFLIAFICYSLFTLGYKTKITGLLCYFFYWNFAQRNPDLIFGWDNYLHILLFWSLFLPLNTHFSLFTLKDKKEVKPFNLKGIVAFAVLFQVALIYGVNALAKNGGLWLDGHAVQVFLLDSMLSEPLAKTVYNHTFFYTFATYATLVFEFLIPLLIFLPFKNDLTRIVASVSIVLFHMGVNLFVDVGSFHLVSLAAAAVLLPTSFWQKIVRSKSSMEYRVMSSYGSRLSFVLCLLILVNIQVNLRTLSKKGYLTEFFSKTGLKSVLQKMDVTFLKQLTPFREAWALYAPNPSNQIGWVVLAAYPPESEKAFSLSENQAVDNSMPHSVYKGPLKFFTAWLRNETDSKKWQVLARQVLAYEARVRHSELKGYSKFEMGMYSLDYYQLSPGQSQKITYHSIVNIHIN